MLRKKGKEEKSGDVKGKKKERCIISTTVLCT